MIRAAIVGVLVVLGLCQVGTHSLERWLLRPCWGLPPLWDSIADLAIQSGAIDSRMTGEPVPWLRASVPESIDRRYAAVTVSDKVTATVWFLNEDYEVVGALSRTPMDPRLVTQETRGIEPLSHIWPLADWDGDGAIETLASIGPCSLGKPVSPNTFAYVSVGGEGNELLFACRLQAIRNQAGFLLEYEVTQPGSPPDLIVTALPNRRSKEAQVHSEAARFKWNAGSQWYEAYFRDARAELAVRYWSTAEGTRFRFGRDKSLDEVVADVLGADREAAPALIRTSSGTSSRP